MWFLILLFSLYTPQSGVAQAIGEEPAAESSPEKKEPPPGQYKEANSLQKKDLYQEPVDDFEKVLTSQAAEVKSEIQKESKGPPPKVEIVIDSSGSMGQILSANKTKMYYLKKMMAKYMNDQWREKASTALRLYGSKQKNDCDDNFLAIKFGEQHLDRIEAQVQGMFPVGRTPLYQSVKDASDDLKSYKGPKRIVVFTDGEETCGGDPCKIGEYVKNNPQLDLKIHVVAIDFRPGSESLKKVSCLGETSVANNEEELFKALSDIHENIDKDRLNLRVISPDPQAQVQLFQKIGNEYKFFRTFTAGWGAQVPPGKYQAVVLIEPPYRFTEFEIPPKKVVTLRIKGEGTVIVNFFSQLLDVEVLDKNLRTIKKFKSDQPTRVPDGSWKLRIYKDPFYETFIEKLEVFPNGKYPLSVSGVGAINLTTNQVKGFYVYDGKGTLLGNYLPNYPLILKSGEYRFFMDDDCSFEKLLVDEEHRIKEVRCLGGQAQ